MPAGKSSNTSIHDYTVDVEGKKKKRIKARLVFSEISLYGDE